MASLAMNANDSRRDPGRADIVPLSASNPSDTTAE
ncbi:hypothetical protein CRES_2070 [Corynebacterium resistens DSM 45100]|uniref:Uncharacterized protein n=1 Tax=Corynebacterium resistens (strain DSM 45100 / JCM 12819 / GTC 2026 / SICGH 158) TaxID=662755 RepID=F8E397_CORRG|nr:hypothetical protein CRES_2070 [Corynebacterium resistens DSM 45100]